MVRTYIRTPRKRRFRRAKREATEWKIKRKERKKRKAPRVRCPPPNKVAGSPVPVYSMRPQLSTSRAMIGVALEFSGSPPSHLASSNTRFWFKSGTSTRYISYHGWVRGIIELQVTRYGIPQLVGTVPLRAGTALHALLCFLPSRRFFSALFCDHGLHLREMT